MYNKHIFPTYLLDLSIEGIYFFKICSFVSAVISSNLRVLLSCLCLTGLIFPVFSIFIGFSELVHHLPVLRFLKSKP